MARPTNAEVTNKLLEEVRKNFSKSVSAESDNRTLAIDDIRFVDEEGAQWDKKTLRDRGNRPAYTFDRVSPAIEQVKGDQRQSTPQIKILPVDSKSDRKVATMYEGLIRAIERNSSARTAYNTGFDFALKGGYGAWRIYPKYVDDSFDQELCIGRIENPFTVHFDPSAKDFLKRDAWWALVTEKEGRDQFEADNPGVDLKSLDLSLRDNDWITSDEVRVAEYYKRIKVEKTLALLDDGRVVDYDGIKKIEEEMANPPPGSGLQPIRVLKTRRSDGTIIRYWKVYGGGILEGPTDYKWKYIPIVPVYGRVANIEGKRKYRGLVRKAKDAQKAFNTLETAALESAFNAPKTPYFVTAAQIKGYEAQWKNANVTNPLMLYYNPDPKHPTGGKPTREPAPEIPATLIALSQQMAENIKATTGKNAASLGEEDNAALPGAIRQRNAEGDISTFEFNDNFAESLRYTGEILVNMIPVTYDGERTVRILGIDGKESFEAINVRQRDGTLMNDLSQGRFDVAVDLGPSYTTQRQQAADYLMKFAGTSEIAQQMASDLLAKNLDFEGADELERRLRIPLIQQGIIPEDKLSEEEKQFLPKGPPPPDPTEVALLQKIQADAERSTAQAAKAKVETATAAITAQMAPAQLEKLIADTIAVQLDNMLKAGEVGIDPHTGRPALMKYLQKSNELAARAR